MNLAITIPTIILALTGATQIRAQQQIAAAGEDFLLQEVRVLNRLLGSPPKRLRQDLTAIADGLLDYQHLADASFGDYCESSLSSYRDTKGEGELETLIGSCQKDLAMAYRSRLLADFARLVRYNVGGTLRIMGYDLRGDTGIVNARLNSSHGEFGLEIKLRHRDGFWRIIDVSIDQTLVTRHYKKLGQAVAKAKYSLPVMLAKLENRNHIVLEDFSSSSVGELPSGWGWRDRDDNKPKPYQVRASKDRHFLAAKDSGGSVILLKFAHWNPREFPILTWCWRVKALPPGGDERYDDTNDSAAGLYVNFSTNWIGLPTYIKYVWSSTLPVGTVDRRKRIARPWFFVVESGENNLGKWVFEKTDLSRDYQRIYSERPDKRTIGLGILSDANSTKSTAHADYADFRAWTREADLDGSVYNHCKCDTGGMSAKVHRDRGADVSSATREESE
jgi:hypothetical protein